VWDLFATMYFKKPWMSEDVRKNVLEKVNTIQFVNSFFNLNQNNTDDDEIVQNRKIEIFTEEAAEL
jgi:hypothetical protein